MLQAINFTRLQLLKHRLILFLITVCMLSGCTDTADEDTNRSVRVDGLIQTLNEFGGLVDEQDGVTIRVSDGSGVFETTSDNEGAYSIQPVAGTYTFSISKQGFPEQNYEGIQLVGGGATTYRSFNISKQSTTSFTTLEVSNDRMFTYVKAKMLHNFVPSSTQTVPGFRLILFISSSPDVTAQNYQVLTGFSFSAVFGIPEEISTNIPDGLEQYTSGTTVYAKLYAVSSSDVGNLDIETGKISYSTISSTPSPTCQFIIP